jgi:hypothetical protein
LPDYTGRNSTSSCAASIMVKGMRPTPFNLAGRE